MLNINFLKIDLAKAKREHIEFYECFITKKLTGSPCRISDSESKHPPRPPHCKGLHKYEFKSDSAIVIEFKAFVQRIGIKTILDADPKGLQKIHHKFVKFTDRIFGTNSFKDYLNKDKENRKKDFPELLKFLQDVSAVFDYDTMKSDSKYSSYQLTENLGIRACVYCNRTYTITHRKGSGGRLMNPQLDHWFPQSKYPLLQVSFHNLIPSCEICNSRVKNDVDLDLKIHFHPYQKENEKLKFDYIPLATPEKYMIMFSADSDTKIRKVSEDLFIDDMYNAHIPELEDMLILKKIYSDTYLNIIKNSFAGMGLDKSDLYRLAFGTEYLEERFHLKPMSKFKSDILNKK